MPQPAHWRLAIAPALACLAALVVAYILLRGVFALGDFPLRLSSILIPIPFGAWFAQRTRWRWSAALGVGVALAATTMLSGRVMLALGTAEPFALLDPRYSLGEHAQYLASMALAFFTGALLASARPRAPSVSLDTIADQAGRLREQAGKLQELIASARELAPQLVPIATAAGALVTGVGEYLGR